MDSGRVERSAPASSPTGRSTVTLVLEMHPEQFRKIENEFVKDLSDLMGYDPSEIEIVDVRDGCTELDIRVPVGGEEFLELLRTKRKDWPEDVLVFLSKYQIRPDPVASQVIISRRNPRGNLAWLHLSDSHFEAPDTGTQRNYWGQDKVRETFIKQLPALLKQVDVQPDMVFFTGDIAFSGKQSEYEVAADFIGQLRKSLPKHSETRVIVVPGNHDVDRGVVGRYYREEEFAKSFLKTNDSVIQYLNSPKHEPDRDRIFERQRNFFNFSTNCKIFGQPELNHRYFFTATVIHNDLNVGIAGLNTAWRAGTDDDRYNLILGVPQLDVAERELKDADVRILLTHHPPETDWFINPDTLYQRSNLQSFDFILRGHEHDPHSEITLFKGSRQYYRISAGALYSSDYAKSFNAVQLNLDTGVAYVFFWRLAESSYKWIRDLEVQPEGEEVLLLPKRLRTRLTRRAYSKKAGDHLKSR